VGLLRIPLVYAVLGLGIPAFAYAVWLIRRNDRALATGPGDAE
jgi:hypothetical protein